MKDIFGYEGKRVVITGAASGMGQAATRLLIELGAEVYALDIKEVTVPVKLFIKTDLGKKEQIDATTSRIPDDIYALFNCAALPGPPFSNLDVMLVNFVGHRHLIETLLPRISDGGAIASISSTGGLFWKNKFDTTKKLLATRGFNEARAWLEANPETMKHSYVFSKECITAYAKVHAAELAKRNTRINTLSPGPTETPMMPAFRKAYGKNTDMWLSPIGRYATPEEMGEPLVFLNSKMARFISGQDLVVDYGTHAAVETGQKVLQQR